MRKRKIKNEFKYGYVLEKESQVFFAYLFDKLRLKNLFSDKKILALGCGVGAEPVALSKFTRLVVGVDIIDYNEWEFFKSDKIEFNKTSSSNLPFANNTFDAVYLKDLLHHIKEVNKTIEEIKRVTKPRGNIVILEANRYNPIFYLYVTLLKGHDHFTQNEFKNLISQNFKNYRFIYLEAYPPFRFPMSIYLLILKAGKVINKLTFLQQFFTYNAAI